MKLFLDTADIEQIKEAYSMGVICGVTTNPSIIKQSGREFEDAISEITNIVDGPVSGEVKATTLTCNQMVEEAIQIAALSKNMVVKIPMGEEGLKAVKILTEKGIRTNVTLVFSATQALLAAIAGASYVSPFIGRLDDVSNNGLELIEDIVTIFKQYNFSTEILCASIRSPLHVQSCAKLGADIATVPLGVIKQMANHPLTDIGIQKFIDDTKKDSI